MYALCHEPQIVIRRSQSVFDLRAPRKRSGANRVSVRVYQRPQTKFPRLIAGGVQLFLRHRHLSPCHTSGGVNLDQVCAGFFLLSHKGANFVRRRGFFSLLHQGLCSGQDARAGKCTLRDGIAQRNGGRRADILHRGEARHQG